MFSVSAFSRKLLLVTLWHRPLNESRRSRNRSNTDGSNDSSEQRYQAGHSAIKETTDMSHPHDAERLDDLSQSGEVSVVTSEASATGIRTDDDATMSDD